jgi:hypothetical protein
MFYTVKIFNIDIIEPIDSFAIKSHKNSSKQQE